MKNSFWVLLILAVFVVIFSVQNAAPVDFSLFIWKGQVSLAVLLISTFIIGAIVGAVYYGLAIKRSRKRKKENIAKDIPFEVDKEELEENESDDIKAGEQ